MCRPRRLTAVHSSSDVSRRRVRPPPATSSCKRSRSSDLADDVWPATIQTSSCWHPAKPTVSSPSYQAVRVDWKVGEVPEVQNCVGIARASSRRLLYPRRQPLAYRPARPRERRHLLVNKRT